MKYLIEILFKLVLIVSISSLKLIILGTMGLLTGAVVVLGYLAERLDQLKGRM